MTDPVAALREIHSRIDIAAKAANRDPASITLVAVSKTYGEDLILPVIESGQRIFGENRVQEAKTKWPPIQDRVPGLKLHLIGPMQSNKVKDAVELFDAIHTVDRPKIAEAIAAEIKKLGRSPELFVQVNTGEEPQKAGIPPQMTAAFVNVCRNKLELPITGLMCIPPIDEEAALHFGLLAKLAAESDLTGLSMGMSDDFETAIALGATHIRVGSAIFGART
ncbi:MAG: YggS family pyridoxal phosphate enzyme [Hyphomicrobium sp. 32-62-53]|nr:MAG: YggS family pyridoxal phosphate enzyme [Hyphomicrobium sp. 12-62-95]OYY01154.1 MAG: YggS family pyridoxal phosphate enzyme [Hyphomicrobium sp. 32-62-53]